MVGGIENEGESMPRTRKNHPPSLKAKVAIEAIKDQKTTTQISPNVRRSPNPSRRLEETSLGRFAGRLRYSSPEWMAAFGPPPGWPAPPSKDTPDFVQTMGSTSVLHSQITIGNSHLISAYQHPSQILSELTPATIHEHRSQNNCQTARQYDAE